MKDNRMNDLPIQDRPYEKCFAKGPKYLTNEELLAVILRTGTKDYNARKLAEMILNRNNNSDLLSIMHYTKEELMKFKGIGKVKAIQILCIGELARRIACTKANEMLDFSNPSSIAEYYMESLRHLEREQLIICYLNTKCKLIKDEVITVGTVNQSLMSPREIFIQALRCGAVNMVMIHNHPSGNSTPSKEDIYSTQRVRQAGQLVGINVVDHIIIGDKTYTSLKQKGIL